MTVNIDGLSERLQTYFDFEINRGNTVLRVDRPAGSTCPLAVIFASPLAIEEFKKEIGLTAGVSTWENKDRHYPLESGYLCEVTRHVLAGPIAMK